MYEYIYLEIAGKASRITPGGDNSDIPLPGYWQNVCCSSVILLVHPGCGSRLQAASYFLEVGFTMQFIIMSRRLCQSLV